MLFLYTTQFWGNLLRGNKYPQHGTWGRWEGGLGWTPRVST